MKELRPYQLQAIQLARDSIKRGNKKIILCLATGAGKSIIAREIVSLSKNDVLFVAHRSILIKQMVDTFKGIDNVKCGTIQKLHKEEKHYKLVIQDECHFGNGSVMQENLKYDFLIGLSATPLTREGYRLEGWDDIIDVIQLPDLIDLGFACPVKVYAPIKINTKDMKTINGDFDQKQAFVEMSKSQIVGDILKVYEQYAKGLKTIIYCVNIKHSEILSSAFSEAGYACDTVHSKKSNDEVMIRFEKGELDIVLNCDVLTTGFDAPDIYCLILATPTKSIVKAVQIYGRGTRLNQLDPDKECLILDCANVIENTQHPMERLNLTKVKNNNNIKKCKCETKMQLKNRSVEPYNEVSYLVKSLYICPNCNSFDEVETIKILNPQACEKCGDMVAGAVVRIDNKKEGLSFMRTCPSCGNDEEVRKIQYTSEELKEIIFHRQDWDSVRAYLMEHRGDYKWQWVDHSIERMREGGATPKAVLDKAQEIISKNKKLGSLPYFFQAKESA